MKKNIRTLCMTALFLAAVLICAPKTILASDDLSECTVKLSKTSFTYTGSSISPEVTVKDGNTVLEEGTDYTLYNASAKAVGTYELTVVGKGDYFGTQTSVVFQIKKAENTITTYDYTFYTYSGPDTWTVSSRALGGASLTYSTSTEGVSITKAGKITTEDGFLGTAKIKVKAAATDSYKSATATFSVKFKLLGVDLTEILNEGAISGRQPDNNHTVTVSWRKVMYSGSEYMGDVDGIQIRFSTDKTFSSGKVYSMKAPMLVGFGTILGSASFSRNLVKGKRYYFQARTYKTALDGKTYYSAWSDSISHKVNSSSSGYQKPINGNYYVSDGIRYMYKNKELTAVGMTERPTNSKLTIPDKVEIYGKKYKVTAIAANAFVGGVYDSSVATKIVIGKYVETIGKNAFSGCTLARSLTIRSKKLTSSSVGKNAFADFGSANYVTSITVKVPSGKRSIYKKILKNAGAADKMKFKILSS